MAPDSVRQSTKFKANCPHNGPNQTKPKAVVLWGGGPLWDCPWGYGDPRIWGLEQAKCLMLIILRSRNFCLVTNSSLFRHIKSLNVNAFIISSHVSQGVRVGSSERRGPGFWPTHRRAHMVSCLSVIGASSPQHAWVILTDRQSVKGNWSISFFCHGQKQSWAKEA